MFKIINISKTYKDKKVLDNINFDIKKGSCLGIIGESGSGKSTLAKIILGIEKANSGEILKNNKPTASIVFQDYNSSVNPKFTVYEILNEPFWNSYKKLDMKNAILLLKSVELEINILKKYPHELSGGQLQRVCIARAIANKPNFLVLDEILSSLDILNQIEIINLLKKIKERNNITYLFITHNLESIFSLCDRFLVIKDGKILDDILVNNFLQKDVSPYTKQLFNAIIPIKF
ncbi:ABC transporter ATP-binding protein [Aliarcobacter vitoriensis]|uniref:Peptide ABC transporter ATP-binding protein n=1 Tax=Aliarcobacter vitoriensis TaxID=2011099 RepID=A0A366MSB1_9BACT|nr:dipeptide/oligopeptide/nickel ABC transporter ATP-binding protein [Aliarcobacter vitoriensis]RBQ28743.1 peptide ABC transporter ATP-binding protein [Aliarcobacter vitoriensis]